MRVLVAMSGGVDSAVAAHLVLAAGHEAVGCTLRLTEEGYGHAEEDIQRAAAVCESLGLGHTVLDLRREFYREVIRPFAEEYLRGRTPNPCVECNRRIKLGRLCEYADAHGFDAVATGHYARIVCEGEEYRLMKARDAEKDQSYMLYHLAAERLSRLLFPLGELKKSEVRSLATELGLGEVAAARESQDICFVPDGSYPALLERVTGKACPRGHFVDAEGRVLGEHRGIVHYTVGQHKGLGIALGRVRYVTGISAERCEVMLGEREDLDRQSVRLGQVTFVGEPPRAPRRAAVMLRYRAAAAMATVYPEGDGAQLLFDEPQRAPAPGQSAVLYEGERVLGGGIIL